MAYDCSMLRNRTFQSTFFPKFGGSLRLWSYGSFATAGSHITIALTHELQKNKLITEKSLLMLIREDANRDHIKFKKKNWLKK